MKFQGPYGGSGGRIPPSRTPSAPLSRSPILDCGFPGIFSSYTRIRTHLSRTWVQLLRSVTRQQRGPDGPSLLSGGSGGSRTHVQEHFRKTFSERSRSLLFHAPLADTADLGFAIPWVLLRYRALTQEVPALMTPGSQAAGDLRPTRGAELCSQCEVVVCFSVSF